MLILCHRCQCTQPWTGVCYNPHSSWGHGLHALVSACHSLVNFPLHFFNLKIFCAHSVVHVATSDDVIIAVTWCYLSSTVSSFPQRRGGIAWDSTLDAVHHTRDGLQTFSNRRRLTPPDLSVTTRVTGRDLTRRVMTSVVYNPRLAVKLAVFCTKTACVAVHKIIQIVQTWTDGMLAGPSVWFTTDPPVVHFRVTSNLNYCKITLFKSDLLKQIRKKHTIRQRQLVLQSFYYSRICLNYFRINNI